MNYISFTELNNIILRNIHRLPHDIDLIVGIPRSGMLPANLLALYLNKSYTDIDSFLTGNVIGVGHRGDYIDSTITKKILVVDDSILTGKALLSAKAKLGVKESIYDIKYIAIFATEESKDMVDFYLKIVPRPRFFQWNILHHPGILAKSCFDIDGVLCEDPPMDDDGPMYIDYITNAIPKYIPTVPINTIVTCRLEKYRSITEKWLEKYHVEYKTLVMLNMPSKKERIKWGQHGKFKGEVYKNACNTKIFIESSLKQAKEILRISKKPVFCIENFSYMEYKDYAPKWIKICHRVKRFAKRIIRFKMK